MLRLHSIFSYNGNGRDNLLWHPPTGLFVYTVGCNIIIEELTNHQQIFLRGSRTRFPPTQLNKQKLVSSIFFFRTYRRDFNTRSFFRRKHFDQCSMFISTEKRRFSSENHCLGCSDASTKIFFL